MQNVVDGEERRRRSATSNHAPRQFDEQCEKPGERDSHKAVPIAITPHRLIAAEVPLKLSPLKVRDILQYVPKIMQRKARPSVACFAVEILLQP